MHQAVKDTDHSFRQHVQGNLATADDKTLTILHQAAKDQDPSLRQASAYALGSRATVDAKILTLLHQAVKDQDEDVREIALEALKTFDSASLTPPSVYVSIAGICPYKGKWCTEPDLPFA
ncbi:MAG: HEAT repeat domain-containing protein [Bacteroidota bacterium]